MYFSYLYFQFHVWVLQVISSSNASCEVKMACRSESFRGVRGRLEHVCAHACMYFLLGEVAVNVRGASKCSEDAGQKRDAPTWLRLKYYPRALIEPNSRDDV